MSEVFENSQHTPLVLRTQVNLLDALSELSPQSRVHSEESLAEMYSVSRTTVREAMQLLQESGLISRDGPRRILARTVRKGDYPAEVPNDSPKDREVIHHLLKRVAIGEIRPGQRFSERTLMKELGYSASPVREALISLAPLGLFRKDQRRQWEAVALDERQIEELTEIRNLIEGYGLKYLMRPQVIKRYRKRLESVLARTRKLGEAKRLNKNQFSKLDVEFHHIILEAPENKILLERNEFIYALVEFQLHNEKFSVERARLGLKQHIYILEAILEGNYKNALRHLMEHLQTAEETLKSFLEI